MEHRLSVRECVRFGWQTFTTRPWYFAGVTFLFCALSALIPSADKGDPWQMMVVIFIISMLLSFFLQLCVTSFALKAHDAPAGVSLKMAWRPDLYLRYVGANLLACALIIIGLVLFIVPGIIIGMGLAFVNFLLVDRNLRPMAALKESWELTKGYRWKIFQLVLVAVVLNLMGALLLLVGLLVSIPVTLFAMIHAYRLVASYKSAPAPLTTGTTEV